MRNTLESFQVCEFTGQWVCVYPLLDLFCLYRHGHVPVPSASSLRVCRPKLQSQVSSWKSHSKPSILNNLKKMNSTGERWPLLLLIYFWIGGSRIRLWRGIRRIPDGFHRNRRVLFHQPNDFLDWSHRLDDQVLNGSVHVVQCVQKDRRTQQRPLSGHQPVSLCCCLATRVDAFDFHSP